MIAANQATSSMFSSQESPVASNVEVSPGPAISNADRGGEAPQGQEQQPSSNSTLSLSEPPSPLKPSPPSEEELIDQQLRATVLILQSSWTNSRVETDLRRCADTEDFYKGLTQACESSWGRLDTSQAWLTIAFPSDLHPQPYLHMKIGDKDTLERLSSILREALKIRIKIHKAYTFRLRAQISVKGGP